MILEKRIKRAFAFLHGQKKDQDENLEGLALEKSDLPVMIASALLVILPAALIALLLIILPAWLLFR